MFRRRLYTVGLAVLAATFLAAPGAYAEPTPPAGPATGSPAQSWPVEDTGEPVHRTLSNFQAIGVAPDGTPEAFFVPQGNFSDHNAEFAAVNLRTHQTVFDTRLPAGYTSTGVVFSPADGNVYVAATDRVFRYRPGTTTIDDLGPAIAGQQIWSLAAGANGIVYGGTYPDGHVFSYDPATSSYHDYGQALAGQSYVTAVEPAGDTVYFGTQPDRELGRLDPATGQVTQIPLPAAHQGVEGKVGFLALRGDNLFVGVDGAQVYDVATGAWTDTISNLSGSAVSPPDPGDANAVYFRVSSGSIVRYHLDTLARDTLPWAPNAFPGAFAWVDLGGTSFPGLTLMFTYYTNCRIYGYNLSTKAGYYVEPAVQGAGDQLINLGEGPDGNVYAGAFQTPPGMGKWNPDTGSWTLLGGSGQVEGYGSYHGNLVFGRYPQGNLYYDDLSKPWAGSNPTVANTIGNEQDRPMAFADLGDQVAVGSAPVSGRLGGAISLWKPDTKALSVFRNVVPNQTPDSLVSYGGLVWGGTSIDGGYGIDPTATSGELFAWDPATHQTVFEDVPLPGATNVSGLVVDGDHLWGLADATLFEFDLTARRIIRTQQLYPGVDGSMYGLEHQLVLDHGRLFGTANGNLFHVDTTTWQAQTLYAGSATNLVQDRYGQLYFINLVSHVYRYDLPSDVTPPTVKARLMPQAPLPAPSLMQLSATDDGVGLAAIEYQIDGGDWQAYQHPVVIPAGPHTVSYRAVDNAWNASPTQAVATR
jgi:hypothetical protein